MSVEITRESLGKLMHEAKEIRLRALEQIEAKFMRATAHNLDIKCNPVDFCRKLLYWFNFKPVETPARVLQLLSKFLYTKYGDEAIKAMGTAKLKHEFEKLHRILIDKTELVRRVEDMMAFIADKQRLEQVESNADDGELVKLVDKMSLSSNDNGDTDAQMFGPNDCEAVWSRPTTADYNSLKFVADVLAVRHKDNLNEINKALLHLQTTMSDYPAEYMLQSPHIFVNLLQLLEGNEVDNQTMGNVIATIKCYLCTLKDRLLQRRKVANYSMPAAMFRSAQQTGLPHFSQNILKPKSQLKIKKAMELLLEKFLYQLNLHPISISSEVLQIIKAIAIIFEILNLQQLRVSLRISQLAEQISLQLQNSYSQEDCHLNLSRGRELWLNFTLHDMAALNAKHSQASQCKLLDQAMYDFSLQQHFPLRFEDMKNLVFQTEPQVAEKYEKLQSWRRNVEAAILILRQANLREKRTATTLLNEAATNFINTLDTLNSMKLVGLIFQAIIECTPNYLSKPDLKLQACDLLCRLLQLKQVTLKAYVYKNVAKAVKKHFVALMNGEAFCAGVPNASLLKALIIGVPMDSKFFELIIHESSNSDEQENEHAVSIKTNAMDTLMLLIRARRFYETAWELFLDLLTPMLPLIQSLLSVYAPLSDAVLKLLDPDTGRLPFLTVFRSNIGLLFQPAAEVRNEALTRLIYMLNLPPESTVYLPNVMEISDILPNDLCILPTPRQFHQIFAATKTYYETSTLYNLLTLLDTADIEPGVRKSTLMQLNVMLKNWELTSAFCELEAHCLLLRVLENSLQKASSVDYIESAIPAISILAKLLIYDSNFRQELCIIPNVYVLLVRALFYFSQDPLMRQNVSICLFLLHFGSYIVVVPPPAGGHFIAPQSFQNLKCPLECTLKTKTFFNVKNKETMILPAADKIQRVFPSEQHWCSYMRQLIAHAYFGDTATLTKNQVDELQTALDICPTFLLRSYDLRFSLATDPMHSIRKLLCTISNVTDDKTLIKASNSLQFYLILLRMEMRGKFVFPADMSNAIFSHLSKYLQVSPGNAKDFAVYNCVLDLFQLCLRLPLVSIGKNLFSVLRNDFNHGMIVMLQNSEVPADFMNRLSIFLADLFALTAYQDECSFSTTTMVQTEINNKRLRECAFRSNLFELLHKLMLSYYANRQLQLVRCVQRIACQLATQELTLPQQKIYEFRKSILRLSIGIRSTTQTGAQWHRNILRIYAQLHEKLKPERNTQPSGNTLKHLVGLAGHNDTMVRALAWLCLCQIAGVDNYPTTGAVAIDANAKPTMSMTVAQVGADVAASGGGASMLAEKIHHLPGGLIGCCLSTFLDHAEIAIVRNYAGLIFVQLLRETCNFEKANTLLEQHAFFNDSYDALENTILDETLPLHSTYLQQTPLANAAGLIGDHEDAGDGADKIAAGKFATCELVILYCRICYTLIEKHAEYVEELCEKPLLFKLYELLKKPPPVDNPNYYVMCAHICQLYAACVPRNMIFLQRTLCHDERWLLCYFRLLLPPPHAPDACVAWILQLLLALTREDFVYQKLCSFALENIQVMQELYQRALRVNITNQPLQCHALSLLTFLLLKSQMPATSENDLNFLSVLETKLSAVCCASNLSNKAADDEDKENLNINIEMHKKLPIGPKQRKIIKQEKLEAEITLVELLVADLYRLFAHIYPSRSCKFEINPTLMKIQICESLAILLKTSTHACKAAESLKLFDDILHILSTFLQEAHTSCAVYVRRYGETKKMAALQNLQVFIQILLNWFAPSAAVLTDEVQGYELTKTLILIWPWLTHSGDLREQVIRLLAFLSERTLMICRQFSTLIAHCSHTILQLVIKLTLAETQKIKTSTSLATHETIIRLALRVIVNCCACNEGRFTLVKEHVLDTFDNLYPFNPKSNKIKLDIVLYWLQFWELFSRYNEGAQARNLNALCDVIQRSKPCSPLRLLCLKILRNMCFQSNNRTTLISSVHFVHTIDAVLSQPIGNNPSLRPSSATTSEVSYPSFEEQYIVSVALWRIVSGGVKYVARIRGTKLLGKMRSLREKLSSFITNEQKSSSTPAQQQPQDFTNGNDLVNILDIIFQIFEE